jgi:protein-L-isoaspartate(D-aspartate) O-methyltransferase
MNTDTLLKAITRKMTLAPRLMEAFRQVDRAIFVPEHYRHRGAEWILEPSGERAYEDTALTTQVTNCLASSSSSQPSVMALMLAALDIQPGNRVLEIGTGTGYNAALLACLVGEHGQVVTVDIDTDLVRSAKKHLADAGYTEQVQVLVADGREGYAQAAPFDRIILTAGFRTLSPAWIEQLGLGGMLVGNMRGNIASVLLKLCKNEPQQMMGHLFSGQAHFMELHGPLYPSICAPNWQQYDAVLPQWRERESAMLAALDDQAFLFFLQGQHPQMQLHLRAIGTPEQHEICKVFLLGESTATVHENGRISARGNVWERIEQAYQCYKDEGAPPLERYQLFSCASLQAYGLRVCLQEKSWWLWE